MGSRGTVTRVTAALSLTSAALALFSSQDVSINAARLLSGRDENDPTDFSWISNWAAIGDSFTAGIGSGQQLGDSLTLDEEWRCSRYDYSYVKIVDYALGSSIQNFQFEACSGDRTGGIYDQVDALRNDLDVVMMTAGGNDLCLGAMIKTCVIMPWDGEDACQAIIDKAQENIDTILKDNIRQVLEKLDGKIKKDGVLVYSGYAPFFNTDNEDCADPTKQNWALKAWRWWQFWNWANTALALTIDRRQKFNTLVEGINKAISEVVEEIDKDTAIGYRATFSDWSDWPGIVDGQFCSPSSTGKYPDPEQPDLLFIKFNTAVGSSPHNEVKRRRRDIDADGNNGTTAYTGNIDSRLAVDSSELDGKNSESESHNIETRRQLKEYQERLRGRLTREHIYNSLLWKSPNPSAAALHKLDKRAPAAPECPGDDLPGIPLGLGLPDSFLSIFHPNKEGHEAMAAYALENLVYTRAQILGVDDGICSQTHDDFTCWQKEGRKAFVDFERVNENYKDFCDDVKPPDNTINWKWEKTYHEGTPDEHTIMLELLDGASSFDKDLCLESLDRIINSCDGGDPNNPLNFKYGGRWVRGNYNYQINPKKDRNMITKKDGTCHGWWKVGATDYRVYGRGWASYDWGQDTLLKSMRDCGSAVTGWEFHYCDDGCGIDTDEYEWESSFDLPVYGGLACMKNNWVPRRSGAEWYSEGSTDLGCIDSPNTTTTIIPSRPGYVCTEADWNPTTYEEAAAEKDSVALYLASKALSEKAVWEWMAEHKPGFDIVCICPSMIFGPAMDTIESMTGLHSTASLLWKLVDAPKPPSLDFAGFIDVRDAALMVVAAIGTPEVGGKRFLLATHFDWQTAADVAREGLLQEVRSRIPVGVPGTGKSEALQNLYTVQGSKAVEILGVEYRPLAETVNDTLKQFLEVEAREKAL